MNDPINDFRDEIQGVGLLPGEIIPDGKIRRCGTSEKPKSDNGWFVLYENPPAGAWGDWQRGLKGTWSGNGGEMDPESWKKLKADAEQQKKARQKEEAERQTKAAKEATSTLLGLPEAKENPYLERKGVKPCPGLKVDGNVLVVPVLEAGSKVISLQRIKPDGEKRFLKGGKAKGGYFTILGPDSKSLYICEGIATGLTVHEATGSTVLLCFSSGNLMAVARMARKKYPKREITICADNDLRTEGEIGRNPGIEAGTEAAEAIKAKMVQPGAEGDFNDLYQVKGLNVVKNIVLSSPSMRVMSLGDMVKEDIKHPPALIEGLLEEEDSLLLTGAGGLGKSLVALDIAFCVASGLNVFGVHEVRKPVNVLIMQSENSRKTHDSRVAAFIVAPEYMAAADKVFQVVLSNGDPRVTGDIEDGEFQKRLGGWIEDADAGLVIMDPLISYHARNENDNTLMRKVCDQITHIMAIRKTAVMIAHHHGKAEHQGQDKSRGATAIPQWARGVLTMTPVRLEGKDLIEVRHTKAGNFRKAKPVYAEIMDGPSIEWVDIQDKFPPLELCRILEAQGGEAKSNKVFVEAIIDALGGNEKIVRPAIQRGVIEGVFIETRIGKSLKYTLPDEGSE